VVIGWNVAKKLSYNIGSDVVVSHGTGKTAIFKHASLPFQVTGILKQTGTPVDNSLYIPLEGITAIHIGWETGIETRKVTVEEVRHYNLIPSSITAVYVGLKNRAAAFTLQRSINNNQDEPLMAILPGATLYELWSIMGTVEKTLTFIAAFVVIIGLVSLLTSQLAVLEQRRREMALLRSLGASPMNLFSLLLLESFIQALLGCLTGLILLYVFQAVFSGALQSRGFMVEWKLPSLLEWALVLLTLISGVINGMIPAWLKYLKSLSDGMSLRS